jgi:hypothetical protein
MAVDGQVHGGQQPISGATIQLYAVSTAGDGQTSTPLISALVKTDGQGAFSIPGGYTCPSYGSLVYVVATGGNPGLASGTNNAALSEMAALGQCGTLASIRYLQINEVTTVASVFPLAPFMTSFLAVGSGAGDQEEIASAFNVVAELVNTSTGTMPGATLPNGYSAPVAQINTLADVLATCINSSGGKLGDGTQCGNLFSTVMIPGVAAPTETIGAALLIARNPGSNVSAIYNLAPPNGPFQGTLTSPPSSWALSLSPAGPAQMPERGYLLGEYLLTEGSGTSAHDTSDQRNDATISGATWEGSQDLNFAYGNYIQLPSALNATRSWQFAIYSAPFGNAQYPLAPGYGNANNFGFNPSVLCGTDTAHLCLISGTPGKSSEFDAFNTDGTQAGVALTPGWHIVSLLCGSNSGGAVIKSHILYDGQEVSSYVTQGDALTCPNPVRGNYQIGGSSTYTGTWFLGKVGAAWAWSVPLTLSEAATAASSALAYLQVKGVTTQFDNAMNPTPLLLAGFDSRTAGFGLDSASQAWPTAMSLTDSTFTRVNLGVIGQLAYDACVQFDVVFGEQLPVTPGEVISILWGGVNDIQYSSQTAAQIAADLKCMVAKAKVRGSRIILATEISSTSGTNPAGDAKKDALDPLIRANAFSWGVDNIADLATDPHLGADGASADATCFPDGLHPSTACEPYVTRIMQNSVNELMGSTSSAHHATSASSYAEAAGDDYLDLTGLGPQTITLPGCTGYSLPRSINNAGSLSAMVATQNAETLNGSGVVALRSTGVFTPVPGAVATGGCGWQRIN